MLGVRQWRHGAFCVSRQHRLCSWWPAHSQVLFMKGWCVYSSMKQCLQSVNHQQFPIQMAQDNKHNKWLEILDFQPKLLWRTPTKIHGRRRRQQEAPRKAHADKRYFPYLKPPLDTLWCCIITGAQPKAGTGLKMQTVSVVFSTLHC